MKNKKIIFILFLSFLFSFIFSEQYKINQIMYEITGTSKQKYLENKLEIDNQLIFQDEQTFNSYIQDLKIKLNDLRQIDSYELITDFKK